MEQELIGQASPEQIAEWKKEYGSVYLIKVDDHVLYLKKPNRATLTYATNLLKEEGVIDYAEAIIDGCTIGGSDIFEKNDEYFLSAMQQIEKLIEVKKSELVKL